MNLKTKTMIIKCPIAMTWSISEYRLAQIKPGECLRSNTFCAFNIPGVQYYLGFYPNGTINENAGETWIYLFLENNSGRKIEADFDISIESVNCISVKKQIFDDASTSGKGEKCCTNEELFGQNKKFIVDEKLTLMMEGTLMIEKEMPRYRSFKKRAFSNPELLCASLWKQENKDFKIVVNGKEIHVHKCILSVQSSVFAKMFDSGMKEAQENRVEIKDFGFEAVKKAIKLCYHQNLAADTTIEEKISILQFFDKYDIQPLKNNFEGYLISEVNESNVCLLANCSLLSNAIKLEKKCFQFLRDCLKTKPVADFDLLDKDFAMKLLKNAFCHVSQ